MTKEIRNCPVCSIELPWPTNRADIIITIAGASVGMAIYTWLYRTPSPGTPQGDIVPELQEIITKAINASLQASDVPIIAHVELRRIPQ
jgi:hypothetical protein